MRMPDLPHGWSDPLHLLEPAWWQRPGPWVALGLALLMAAWWWWRVRRLAANAPGPPPVPSSAPAPSALAATIRELRERYRSSGELREGLHRLSVLLREHLARRLPSFQRRPGDTALELSGKLADSPAAPLLRTLSAAQFGGSEPRRKVYDEIFRQAEELAGGRSPGGRR